MKKQATKTVAVKKRRTAVKRKTRPTPAVVASASPVNPERVTKTQAVILLIQRERGATMSELCEVTGWQVHSVRGFISGTLRKKQGLVVTLLERENGERAYRLPGAATG